MPRVHQPGLLSMCDTCLRSWHDDCVSLADRQRIAAAAAPGSAWSCSVCVGEPFAAGFVGNPQRGGEGRQPEPQALPLSAGGLAGDARKGEEGGPEGRGAAVPLARATEYSQAALGAAWISCNVLLDALTSFLPQRDATVVLRCAAPEQALRTEAYVGAALFAAPPGDPATSCPPGTACSISVAVDCV